MQFVNIDNKVMDTNKMKSFHMNEKVATRKAKHYRALIKIDMRTEERTELRRVYRQSELEALREESRKLNQRDVDKTWYYTIIAGADLVD